MAFTGVSPIQTNDAATATLSTSNATATVIYTLTVPTGAVGMVQSFISGKDNSTNTFAGQFTVAYKNVGGTVSVVGTINSITFTDVALTTCAVTAVASTNTLTLKVAGVAATDIQWQHMTSVYSN